MKKLMTLGLLATSCAFADAGSEVTSLMQAPVFAEVEAVPVEAAFGYVSLGLGPFPLPLPLLGFGGRYQKGHHGVDGSVQFFTIGPAFTIAKENIDYLYYFKPNLASQFYMGAGVGVTEAISRGDNVQAFLSPQVILGKQYTNEAGDVRFFQAQIDPVFVHLNSLKKTSYNHGHGHKKHRHINVGAWPTVVLTYGICF